MACIANLFVNFSYLSGHYKNPFWRVRASSEHKTKQLSRPTDTAVKPACFVLYPIQAELFFEVDVLQSNMSCFSQISMACVNNKFYFSGHCEYTKITVVLQT